MRTTEHSSAPFQDAAALHASCWRVEAPDGAEPRLGVGKFLKVREHSDTLDVTLPRAAARVALAVGRHDVAALIVMLLELLFLSGFFNTRRARA